MTYINNSKPFEANPISNQVISQFVKTLRQIGNYLKLIQFYNNPLEPLLKEMLNDLRGATKSNWMQEINLTKCDTTSKPKRENLTKSNNKSENISNFATISTSKAKFLVEDLMIEKINPKLYQSNISDQKPMGSADWVSELFQKIEREAAEIKVKYDDIAANDRAVLKELLSQLVQSIKENKSSDFYPTKLHNPY